MKKLFIAGLVGLLFFEIFNVYFIMPMPGSQKMNSIDAAYFLYRWRWLFRGVFAAMLLFGLTKAPWKRKWVPLVPVILVGVIIYYSNFVMAADHMFHAPTTVAMVDRINAKIDSNRLVIGVELNGEAKAYPIQYLGYHHQVQDEVGGKPVLVTYCTVCRTGRVYEPVVKGKKETFRLVGMDHFNAMFEDATTKSWWQQATGKAVTGKLKGTHLPEVFSAQTTLAKWAELHPSTLVMQPDTLYKAQYDSMRNYESGKGKSALTRTDTSSWKDKSWVVGITLNNESKAYDWNRLKAQRVIDDRLGNRNISLVLAKDNNSFFAFEKPTNHKLTIFNDTLLYNNSRFKTDGSSIDGNASLKRIPAYQEFWHSWRTFHKSTKKGG